MTSTGVFQPQPICASAISKGPLENLSCNVYWARSRKENSHPRIEHYRMLLPLFSLISREENACRLCGREEERLWTHYSIHRVNGQYHMHHHHQICLFLVLLHNCMRYRSLGRLSVNGDIVRLAKSPGNNQSHPGLKHSQRSLERLDNSILHSTAL